MAAIITLTTDFGTQDGFVGAMKGRLLSICPEARLIDITHDIHPQNLLQGAWTILRATRQFPEESIHVVVIDPGVGSHRRPVLIRSDQRWYIGPDNGVFSEIIRQYGTEEIHEIQSETEWWQAHNSFDGLALFAPVAAHLAAGLSPQKFCKPIDKLLTILPKSVPSFEGSSLRGKILQFDRFGNALTDIATAHLEKLGRDSPTISCQRKIFQLVSHYEEGHDKKAIAIINSDGFLELSVYCASAEKKMDLKMGDPVTIT